MTEGPELDREGLEMLATAVVRQAYEDYLWTVCETMHLPRGEALNRRRVERMELEAFFLSRYYSCLCPVQPETLMQQLSPMREFLSMMALFILQFLPIPMLGMPFALFSLMQSSSS